MAKTDQNEHLKLSPQNHVLFLKVFFWQRNIVSRPGKYPWQELSKSLQALIIFLIPLFQNLGLKLVPMQKGGWGLILWVLYPFVWMIFQCLLLTISGWLTVFRFMYWYSENAGDCFSFNKESKISLKLVSAIFYQIFIFSPNDSPFKTVENVFYFI